MSGWQIASLRSGIAAAALFAYSPRQIKRWNLRILLIAFAYAATLILFVTANKLTTSANAIFLQSTGALYLLLLGPFILKERIRGMDIAMILSIAAGTALLFAGSDAAAGLATNPRLGDILAALSGLTWALTLTGLRLLGKQNPQSDVGLSLVILGNVFAFVIALPLAFPFGFVGVQNALVLIYLGVFQIGLAYLSMTRGIRSVPGLQAATILLIEPVFNPIWTWLIHHEQPSTLALAGGALIILTNLIAACFQRESAVTN